MISYPHILVCYCRFDMFYGLLLSQSLCSAMNVRSPKWWDTKHSHSLCYSVLSVYCWRVFCLGFFNKFDVCMVGKTTVLSICIHQTSQIDWFRRVYKILRWIGSSDFKLKTCCGGKLSTCVRESSPGCIETNSMTASMRVYKQLCLI